MQSRCPENVHLVGQRLPFTSVWILRGVFGGCISLRPLSAQSSFPVPRKPPLFVFRRYRDPIHISALLPENEGDDDCTQGHHDPKFINEIGGGASVLSHGCKDTLN